MKIDFHWIIFERSRTSSWSPVVHIYVPSRVSPTRKTTVKTVADVKRSAG